MSNHITNQPVGVATQVEADLDKLPLPNMSWKGMLKHFGPGLILMMTGVGTSHLITAPTAGGRFEYALLWCIPIAYIFKYYGFEMAFRFTNATGKSLIEAYGTAWKKWPLWYVMITTIIQSAIGQAGRLVAAAAVAYTLFTTTFGFSFSQPVYGFVLGLTAVVILLRGNYAAVETATKILAGMLIASTFLVFFVSPVGGDALSHFFILDTPAGSWLIIAAFLGLLPTGIDVSLQASEWGKAKKVGMGRIRPSLEKAGLAPTFDPFNGSKADLAIDTSRIPGFGVEYCRRWFRIGLWDFRFGHTISFFLACIFLLLAAVWMYPSEVEGRAVMSEIARIFTDSLGQEMMLVFLLGAFAATYSTAFNYFDGWPRIVGACCRNMFRSTASLQGIAREDLTEAHRRHWYSEYNIYRLTMLFSLVSSVAIIYGMPRPVYLVLVASALALFVAPVIYFLNLYYCLTVIPKTDKHFYPSKLETAFSWLSLIVFTVLTAFVILARVFNVELFGV